MKKDEIMMCIWMTVIGIVFSALAFLIKLTVIKWILIIISIAILGLVVLLIIDSIIHSIRNKRSLSFLFDDVSPEKLKMRRLRKETIFNSQRPLEDDYGYTTTNPIMTMNIFKSDAYLKKLRTLDGQRFTWERMCSYCMSDINGVENVMVDEYQLFLNGRKYIRVYICPEGFDSTYAPKGMQLIENQ